MMLGRPATYEDLVKVPDHLVAEIVDGELWTCPPPAPRHAWLVEPIARTLEVLRRQADLWTLVATFGGADHLRAEPFDEIQFELPLLWDEPASSEAERA